jgi:hypothetical protein
MLLLGLFIGYLLWYRHDGKFNPHAKNGVDTVLVNDTVYAFRFHIDTAYRFEQDIEPKERP